MPKGKILYVVNVDWFFISHRLRIAVDALADGYEVHVACAFTGSEKVLEAKGFHVHELSINRSSLGLMDQITTIMAIRTLLLKIKPDIVHGITIKPVIFAGILSRIYGVPYVAAIAGLGFTFTDRGVIASLKRSVLKILYKMALGKGSTAVIFQNDDDRALVTSMANLRDHQIYMIYGSGVDLEQFPETAIPDGEFVAVFAARLLETKGLRDYVEAATILKQRGYQIRFIAAGTLDSENPASITAEELTDWKAQSDVEFPGHIKDMASLFANCHVAVLPSYREGMPLSLLQAAACGRAIVTTNVPGCRQAIIPNVTGLLVQPRNPEDLSEALAKLAENSQLVRAMGHDGRKLAIERFSLDSVVEKHMKIYEKAMAHRKLLEEAQ